MKKYLISGMGPSEDGTGKLIEALIPVALERGYRLYFPTPDVNFVSLLRARNAFGLLIELRRRIEKYLHLLIIRNSRVILIHPQTFGFKRLLKLIERMNQLRIYVVDNSYFCMQSYNHRRNKDGECFDCLGNPGKPDHVCAPFPIAYNKKTNIKYLKKLKSHYGAIKFFVQNKNQGDLLKKHFGDNVQYQIIGLLTSEFVVENNTLNTENSDSEYDMVYHGNPVEAKGVLYVLRIAAYLKEFSILIPCARDEIRKIDQGIAIPTNVAFRNIRWKSGLDGIIKSTKLVLCPSLWSAPIEGALIKSIIYNGNVAVYNTRFGFQREIPDGLLLRLDMDMESSAKKIRKFLNDRVDLSERSRKWVRKFIADMDVTPIFE